MDPGYSTSHFPAMFLRNNFDSGVTLYQPWIFWGTRYCRSKTSQKDNQSQTLIVVGNRVSSRNIQKDRKKSNPNIVGCEWIATFLSVISIVFFWGFATFMWDPWAISGPQFHLSSARLAHHAQVQPAASVAVEQRQHQGREDLRFHGIQTQLLKITIN